MGQVNFGVQVGVYTPCKPCQTFPIKRIDLEDSRLVDALIFDCLLSLAGFYRGIGSKPEVFPLWIS
jgi:hypothetical protein